MAILFIMIHSDLFNYANTKKREKSSREQVPTYPKNGKYPEDNTEDKPTPKSVPLVLQVAMKVFDGVKTLF